MRQRCTGPLVYTIKSGVLFVCLFVCDARHAFRGRGSKRGVRGVHGMPSTGRGATPVSWRSGPRARRYVISKYLWAGYGRKMGKMAKIREIPEKSHDPNPAVIMLLGATDNLLKIKTSAKMH